MIASAARGHWLLASCLITVACTYLVEPRSDEIKCVVSARKPNPCPDALVCIDGTCAKPPACSPLDPQAACPTGLICRDSQCIDPSSCPVTPDVCGDLIDNDCDGEIDEVPSADAKETCGDGKDNDCDGKQDEGFDEDGDGFTWCGDTTMPNGGPRKDCEDDPRQGGATRHPGGAEVCNGIDDDCDERTDETAENKSLCAAGETCIGRCVKPSCAIDGSITCRADQMCDVTTGKCVARKCEMQCPPNEFCDAETGTCTSNKRPNGSACAAHDECLSGSCIEADALGARTSARRLCGQTCCSDDQCTTGERCFVSGTGARSCLPAALAAMTSAGDVACAHSSDCGVDNACRFEADLSVAGSFIQPRNDLIASVCSAPPRGALALGDDCQDRSLCPSGECISPSFDARLPVCTLTCGTSEDCTPLQQALGTSARVYCAFGTPLSDDSDSDFAAACIVARTGTETGEGRAGASCRSGSECLDGACVGAAGYTNGFCAPTCCNDSQCSAVNGQPTYCRPVAFGGHYETRCIP